MWRIILNTLIVDLDDTICFPNHEYNDTYRKYSLATPNIPFIKALRLAKSKGAEIVIHSARRMLTHQGDVDAIEKDVREVTEQWLDEYDVPYDKLLFGKPYGTYYIDDKALRPEELIDQMGIDVFGPKYA